MYARICKHTGALHGSWCPYYLGWHIIVSEGYHEESVQAKELSQPNKGIYST